MDQNIDRIVGEYARSIWGALLVEQPPGRMDYDRIVVQFDNFALECGWTDEAEVTTRIHDGQADRPGVEGLVWTEIMSAEELAGRGSQVSFAWQAVNQQGYEDLILVALDGVEPTFAILAASAYLEFLWVSRERRVADGDTQRTGRRGSMTVDVFIALVGEYETAARRELEELKSALACPNPPAAWADLSIPRTGTYDGKAFSAHGFGCRVETPDGAIEIELSKDGGYEGFDAWRLWTYAADHAGPWVDATLDDVRTALKWVSESGGLERVTAEPVTYLWKVSSDWRLQKRMNGWRLEPVEAGARRDAPRDDS